MSVLSKAKDEVDFGLHGRDTMAKLEQGEAERFDPKRLAYHIFKQHESEEKKLTDDDKQDIKEKILTHPWSSKRQKMVLGMQCEAMVKRRFGFGGLVYDRRTSHNIISGWA